MRSLSRLLLVLSLFLGFQTAKATHLLGGEITWACSSNGNYIFTLTLYRDCNGIPLGTNAQTINNPAGSNITCNFVSQTDISPDCWNPSNPLYPVQITCAAAVANTGPDIPGAVEKYVYRSAAIPLNGVPPAAGWEFWWSSCCRPSGNQNTSSGPYYLRAKMFPYTAPGATSPSNVSTCFDNSPIFAEDGSPVICTGYKFVYNHLAADLDLDSLSFGFADPLQSAGNPVVWNPGYTSQLPFPDQSEDPTNGPVTLDPVSGEMEMEVNQFGSSSSSGSYASCVKIEAWKSCQLVAIVYRDVAVSMVGGCPGNLKPASEIDTALFEDVNRLSTNVYQVSVYPTDTIDFELSAQDFDFLPSGLPQSITFAAGGLQVSSPLGSGTGCLGSGTCAKITPVAPQSSYTQGLNNTVRFFWAPDCGHLGAVSGCGSVTSTYYFTLKMIDDGCPAPAVSITTLIVDVLAGDPSPPPFSSLFQQSNGDVDILWNQALQDSALDFNYYKIYGATNINGPYSVVDSIIPIDSLQTTMPAASGFNHFYMVKSTGACDFISNPSDTLSLINMNLLATPPAPNSEYADISWTALHAPLLGTSRKYYEIYARTAVGAWVFIEKIDEVPNAPSNYVYTFKDTVQFCDDIVEFQVRVVDTVNGNISGSNYQSSRFSDKTNADIIRLDSVTVVNNQSTFSFNPTSSGDVIYYYIFFNDPLNGWITVDSIPVGTAMPYTWTASMADTRSEQFKVVTIDSCGNISDIQLVVSHNTINLRTYLNRCDGTVRLGWNAYEGFANGVGGYNVYMREDNGSGFGSPILLFTGSGQDTSYTRENLTADTEYCFYVRAYNGDTTKTSTSNESCIIADVPQKSRILYMAQVSNNFLRESIDLKAFIDGEADVKGYDIERSTEENGIYEVIGNVAKPLALPYVVNFSDFSADPEITYYYRLKSHNLCGGIDGISNTARNIVLNVEPNPNLSNKVIWKPYGEWGGGVGRYDIYRSVDDNTDYQLVGTNAGDDTTFVDDISAFGEQTGKFCYYVLAVEDNNPLGFVDDNGQPFTSVSNQICKNQKARVYVPTAFRPDSDIEANRVFGPSMRFEEIDQYDFYILNRWGAIVFRTSDPAEFWDGKIEGENAPMGVYVYYLKFSTLEDMSQEEKGTFTLVR